MGWLAVMKPPIATIMPSLTVDIVVAASVSTERRLTR
jgi:hypothetical protein